MRKLFGVCFIVACIGFVCLGCASVKKSVDYYEACKSDSACYAQMVQNGNISEAVVKNVAKATKLEDMLGAIAFNIASGLTGIILGRKMKRC